MESSTYKARRTARAVGRRGGGGDGRTERRIDIEQRYPDVTRINT